MHPHCPVTSEHTAKYTLHILVLFYTLLLCQFQLSFLHPTSQSIPSKFQVKKKKVSFLHPSSLSIPTKCSHPVMAAPHAWLCNFLSYCPAARVMEWARSQCVWSQYFSGGTIHFLLKWISKVQQFQQIQQNPFSLFGGWPHTSPGANKEAQSEDWIYRWFTWQHFCSS